MAFLYSLSPMPGGLAAAGFRGGHAQRPFKSSSGVQAKPSPDSRWWEAGLLNRRFRILDIEMRRTGAAGMGPLANDMVDLNRPVLDWLRLSEGLGVPAVRAATAGELAREFERAIAEPGPRLIQAVLAT
jgi:hypothetical protein